MITRPAARILAALLVLLTGILLIAPAAATGDSTQDPPAGERDPFLLDAAPPRVVTVPAVVGDPSQVRLLDAFGNEIPLTGRKVVVEGGSTLVYPPRLPVGRYRIEYPGGGEELLVGGPVEPAPAGQGSGSRSLLWLLLAVPAIPGVLLLRRRPKVAVVVIGVSLSAAAGGLLLGSGPERAALRDVDPCPVELSEVYGCATHYITEVAQTEGLATAYGEIRRLSSGPGSPWAPVCHEVAHDLGNMAWRLAGSVSEAIAAGGLDCSLGYIHGFQQSLGTYLSDEEFPTRLREACEALDANFLPAGSVSIFGCHHGAGHAAMWRFNEVLDPAVKVCDSFELPGQREECRVGAVMEWVYAGQRADRTGRDADRPEPRVGNPIELCAPPHGTLSAGCVEGALTAVKAEQVEQAASWCADRSEVLEACLRSLARRVVQIDLSEGTPLLSDVPGFCASFPGAEQNCAMQVGYMHLFMTRDRSAASRLCDSLPSTLVASCRSGNEQVVEYAEKLGDGSFNFRD